MSVCVVRYPLGGVAPPTPRCDAIAGLRSGPVSVAPAPAVGWRPDAPHSNELLLPMKQTIDHAACPNSSAPSVASFAPRRFSDVIDGLTGGMSSATRDMAALAEAARCAATSLAAKKVCTSPAPALWTDRRTDRLTDLKPYVESTDLGIAQGYLRLLERKATSRHPRS